MYDDNGIPQFPLIAKLGIAAVALMIILGVFYAMFTARVDAGQACAVTRFGKSTGSAPSGFNTKTPFDKFHCFSTRLTTYEIVADPETAKSNANYLDWGIGGKTYEGIDFVAFASAQYHVPGENVELIYQTVGRTEGMVFEQVVKRNIRDMIPQILNTYTAQQLYLGDLSAISLRIETDLRTNLEAKGLVLDYFELRRPDFDDRYESAISDKALTVEETARKSEQQKLALAEAERVRIETEGVAAKTVIEAQAEAEKLRIDAQAKADAQVALAEGEAQAIEKRGTALAENPEVLEWERIQAIRSANVIYLPSDSGVIPILPLDPNKQ